MGFKAVHGWGMRGRAWVGVQDGVRGIQEWGFKAVHGWGVKDGSADLSGGCRREFQGRLWV